MARAAILMAVLCIGFAAYAMGGAIQQGWRLIADSGLIAAPVQAGEVVRVVRRLDRALPDRPHRTSL